MGNTKYYRQHICMDCMQLYKYIERLARTGVVHSWELFAPSYIRFHKGNNIELE